MLLFWVSNYYLLRWEEVTGKCMRIRLSIPIIDSPNIRQNEGKYHREMNPSRADLGSHCCCVNIQRRFLAYSPNQKRAGTYVMASFSCVTERREQRKIRGNISIHFTCVTCMCCKIQRSNIRLPHCCVNRNTEED